ncbi:2-amino-4-hydroxy-6-hydroxymethyldihydropteridine diphosphokinase [uncultured Treponema sp.]|uniref:2-amino-4-hydroxy-6- hydroxymethyldihydropteridine diphosphokinase n=1 Tax=uncultured Treponema sp. TaxID=162155 RepID=UPI0025F94274|nr:2-amino-4-hydroxy-6-hydroxymethyldihydropteridine diphosphokinase [uncultured Treponema sp.]
MFTVLGLGSNKNFASLDSVSILASACVNLRSLFETFFVSSIYRTEPMYVTDQPCFYNMAVCGETNLSVHELLSEIHLIEEKFGRNRDCEIRNGQRSLDIDIELFGNEAIHFIDENDSMNNIEIPHPRLTERAFVLIPLLEVLPQDADIQNKEFLKETLAKIGSQGAVKCLSSSEFAKIVSEKGAEYGRAVNRTESDCN